MLGYVVKQVSKHVISKIVRLYKIIEIIQLNFLLPLQKHDILPHYTIIACDSASPVTPSPSLHARNVSVTMAAARVTLMTTGVTDAGPMVCGHQVKMKTLHPRQV